MKNIETNHYWLSLKLYGGEGEKRVWRSDIKNASEEFLRDFIKKYAFCIGIVEASKCEGCPDCRGITYDLPEGE